MNKDIWVREKVKGRSSFNGILVFYLAIVAALIISAMSITG